MQVQDIGADMKKTLESLVVIVFCICLLMVSGSAGSETGVASENREIFLTVHISGNREEPHRGIILSSRVYSREIAYICNYLNTDSVLENEAAQEWGTVEVRAQTEQGEWVSKEIPVDAAQKELIDYINGIEEGKFKNMAK